MAIRREFWLIVVLGCALAVGACTKDPEAAMRRHLASGDKYLADGKLAEAVIEYRNAVQQQPNSGEARTKLAEAHLKAGDAPNAFREFVRAADLKPGDVDSQLKAGGFLLLAAKYEDARGRAEKALALAPKSVPAHILLANSLAGLKDLNAAVAEMEEAISLEPQRGTSYSQLGLLELGRGKADEAEAAFKKATELDGRSVTARMSLANFYAVTGRRAEAEAALKQSLEIDSNHIAANRAMASFLLATNRAPEAEPYLKKVVDVTKSPAAVLNLADYYISRGADPAAIAVLEPLVSDPKTAAEAGVRLAALDNRRGHPKQAYERLEAVLAKDQTNLQALGLKTALLLSEGKNEDAFAAATAAVTSHKGSATAHFMLGRVQAARKQTDAAIKEYEEVLRLNPRANQAKVALSQLHLARGQTETSVLLAEEAVRTQPRNVQAKLLLVRGLLSRGELKRAESELDPLLKQFPNSALVHVYMGMLRGLQSNQPEARRLLDRAQTLAPDSMEALTGHVALDLGAKKFADARRRVDERLTRGDTRLELLMLAARIYAADGDDKGAESLLRRALQADSSHLPAYGALGQLYMRQRRLDEARAEFETLAKRDPKPVGALTMIATILQMQGNNAAARERYERVMELDSEAPVAANNLAWIYATQGGNLDVALQLAQTAKRRLPDNPDVNDTLGYVYYKKDLQNLAIPALKASLAKNGNSPVYHSHLGLAYAKAGDVDNARQHLMSAFKLKPDFDGAQEARRVLDSLPAR